MEIIALPQVVLHRRTKHFTNTPLLCYESVREVCVYNEGFQIRRGHLFANVRKKRSISLVLKQNVRNGGNPNFLVSKSIEKVPKTEVFGTLELLPGFEPGTSSLPRMRSTG